jgi:hypothetical protein
MTAAAQDRAVLRWGTMFRKGRGLVAASTELFAGTMVARNASGYLVPASNAAGLLVAGVVYENYDNDGGDAGDVEAEFAIGVHGMLIDADQPVTAAQYGRPVYCHDDQTICGSGEGSLLVAGVLEWIDEDGIAFVNIGDPAMLYLASAGGVGAGYDTVSADGAIPVTTETTFLAIDGTMAFTLANGTYVGQRKYIRAASAANTPSGVITPANLIDGATITMNAADDEVELEWRGVAAGGWKVIDSTSVTVA